MVIKETVRIKASTVSGSDAQDEMVRQQSSMTKNLAKIAVSVGITALIWKGLEPILTPLIKLLSLIALVVFLPLLPFVKQIAERLRDVVTTIKDGQGDEAGLGGFLGGLGAFIPDSFWESAGLLIGAAIIISLTGASLAGGLAVVLGTVLALGAIGEDEVVNELIGAGLIGLAAFIGAGIVTGNPIAATLFGALAFSLATNMEFGTVTKEVLVKAIEAASIVGIAAALVVGIMTGSLIAAVLVGSILFILSMIFDLTRPDGRDPGVVVEDFAKDFGQTPTIHPIPLNIPIDLSFLDEEINNTKGNWMKLNQTIIDSVQTLPFHIDELGNVIGNTSNDASLAGNILIANKEWSEMGTNSSIQINGIISNLSRIPRNITTVHTIITRRKSEGFSSFL